MTTEIPLTSGSKQAAQAQQGRQAPAQQPRPKPHTTIPWTEKYRPTTLDDVIGNDELAGKIKALVASNSYQNIMMVGKEGLGKTTIAFILAKIWSGNVAANIKSINASAFGNVKVLRGEIIPFCKASTIYGGRKVIILDEFDAATTAMQFGFRRPMEDFTRDGQAVFILCCNYEHKVLPAIQSRCLKYRFSPIPADKLYVLGERILTREGVSFNDPDLKDVIQQAHGKPRDLINLLQQNVVEGHLVPPGELQVEKSIKAIMKALIKDTNLEKALILYDETVDSYGITERDFIRQLSDVVITTPSISTVNNVTTIGLPQLSKSHLLSEIGETDKYIADGATPDAQIRRLLARIFILAPAISKNKREEQEKVDRQRVAPQ